ncbi:MAG TPA: GAF domain-containing protein [Candidatus Sulfotelmatobacter sp.]|nr:GAF domain-containing protein [Candidatus Sulfotelmatobacter sp.]
MTTTPGSNLDLNLAGFASRLLAASEASARARLTAQSVLDRFPGATAILYLLLEDDEGLCWSAFATVGDGAQPDPRVPAEAGTLGSLVRDPVRTIYEGRELVREDYAHLNIRRTLKALACLPLIADDTLIGAIEILSFDAIPDRATLDELEPLLDLAAHGLKASQAYEEERNNSLNSVTRLTQFYDIEKVFSSTLEMDELLPIIGGKMREMLECSAVNIWLLQGDESLLLMHQAGEDPTTRQNSTQKAGEGIAADVSNDGEPRMIHDPSDERLARRNLNVEDCPVHSIMVAPLLDKGSLVGVVEAVNRLDGAPFDEDDLFVLTSLNETASIALHNASLLLAERKVEVLEMLVTVSREITSTLNLERVLQTIVDAPQALIPYERAAIALQQSGKYKLSAVSGVTQLDPDAADIAPLNDLLRWSFLSEGVVHVRQHGDEIDSDREETRAKFRSYFEASGMRAFYAIPLNDDTGRVGIMGLVSPDPDFLSPAHIEVLQVIAGQATVALRNAQMYKEVPFISVLEPMLEKKRKFMAMEKRRRSLILAASALLLIFLAVFPLPMRVDGDALVAPLHSAQVQPAVEGVVRNVYVHEGDQVVKGQVIAELADWDFRSMLAQAQAKYQTALLEMNHALAINDGSNAGAQRVQADYWKAEVARDQELLDKTQLRSPIDGVIATPHVENMVGRRLQYGDSFAEVVDTSRAIVDVAIDDTDAALLRPGSAASVKLNGFPTRTFHGSVALVSPKGAMIGEARVFFARVAIANQDGAIRAGMEGRGKVRVGWYPSGYVLFRRPLVWLYSRIWSWFGI